MDDDKEFEEIQKRTTKRKSGSGFKMGLSALLFAGLLAGGIYFATTASKDSSEQLAAKNAEISSSVLADLGSVLEISSEDEPTVATVDNADSLRAANEEFYQDAQNGDYLVLYPQRAIIFRQSEKKIINIAPIINTGVSNENTEQQ